MQGPRTTHLLQDVLLPHQLLPLPVGFGHHDVQHVLAIVGDITDKEHQVLQQLDHEPAKGHGVSGLGDAPCPNSGPCSDAGGFWGPKNFRNLPGELLANLHSLLEVTGWICSPYGSCTCQGEFLGGSACASHQGFCI